ncbi:YrhC family protein [Bacillus solimangrovi]|uniref:YrhC-like protein n=1 Tax=Bacillus solimangrovi TaxID=1305675 RepID=A0A1E5LBQ2_9BACI|nr:YrhC family protein [Bacillus solimangrovi]OEH91527.1 hypothetical protein BFG57_05285 [Bacillus solimangrovi]
MESQQFDRLSDKVQDYTNYSKILLMISIFFFMGTLMLMEQKTNEQLLIILVSTFCMLLTSGFFQLSASKIKKQINEQDQSSL